MQKASTAEVFGDGIDMWLRSQGENIKIDISSPIENTRNIYLFKNDKLLKMISTDSSETTINLNDEYGLIDIYVTQNGKNQNSYNYKSNYKDYNVKIKTVKIHF